MAAIFQTTFSNAFSLKKMLEFRLKFHWNLFLRVQSTIFQHWFRKWLGTVHYLNQCWLEYRRIYASLGLNELMQNCSIFIAKALEVPKSCIKPSIHLQVCVSMILTFWTAMLPPRRIEIPSSMVEITMSLHNPTTKSTNQWWMALIII